MWFYLAWAVFLIAMIGFTLSIISFTKFKIRYSTLKHCTLLFVANITFSLIRGYFLQGMDMSKMDVLILIVGAGLAIQLGGLIVQITHLISKKWIG